MTMAMIILWAGPATKYFMKSLPTPLKLELHFEVFRAQKEVMVGIVLWEEEMGGGIIYLFSSFLQKEGYKIPNNPSTSGSRAVVVGKRKCFLPP